MRKIATNRCTLLGVLASLVLLLPLSLAQPAENVQTSRTEAVSLVVPTEQESFTFLVFGDRTSLKAIGAKKSMAVLKAAVAEANRFSPDFVMNVGDMVQGYNTTEEWIPQMEEYKAAMDELHCPWLPTAGNHDVYGQLDGETGKRSYNNKAYERNFGPLWYAFEYKNNWFIVLFTDEGDPKTGEKTYQKPEGQMMSEAQFQWLKSTLDKAANADGIYVFQHHPRWQYGSDHLEFDNTEYGYNWGQVHEILVKAGNVKVVFGGHIHRITEEEHDGIQYITLATTGGSLSEYNPTVGRLQEFHHVTIRKNAAPVISLFPVPTEDDDSANGVGALPQPITEQPQTVPSRETNIPVLAP